MIAPWWTTPARSVARTPASFGLEASTEQDDDGNRVDEPRDIVPVPQGTVGTDCPIGMYP